MHYYQWSIKDYKSHTEHLSELEDLAYRRMIDWCYLHEKGLPNDHDEIARLIRMRTHCECIAVVLREFFCEVDGEFLNKHIDEDLQKYRAKSDKARDSANARWAKNKSLNKGIPDECERNANALQTQCEGNANYKPLTNNYKPLTNNQEHKDKKPKPKKSSLPDDFEITEKMHEWYSDKKFTENVKIATEAWVDSMLANTEKFKYTDWTRAWQTGMRNHQKWNHSNTSSGSSASSPRAAYKDFSQ